jgi:gliding motility-associated-like protein
MKSWAKILVLSMLQLCAGSVQAQLLVADNLPASNLVKSVLLADGIEVRNISYQGYDRSIALFDNGLASGLDIQTGVILSSGLAVGSKGPNYDEGFTSGAGAPGSKLLNDLFNTLTLDAAVLSFDFKPLTPNIEFKYVFSSDEYIEWVDEGFNDIFGFFVEGPGIVGSKNVALVPGTNTEVSINSINHKRNSEYFYRNIYPNEPSFQFLQHDGSTVTLTAKLNLEACEWYTIRLAIADVGDADKDSWVFIEAESFKHQTNLGEDTFFCANTFSLELDAGNEAYPVEWSTGDTSHKITVTQYGTYTVEVFTPCGSFKDDIIVGQKDLKLNLGPDTVFCANTFTQTLRARNTDVYDAYLWSNGSTEDSLEVYTSGTYSLRVEKEGCFDSTEIRLTAKPVPEFDLGKDTVICGSGVLEVFADAPSANLRWEDNSSAPIRSITSSGIYHVTADLDGCLFSDTIEIGFRRDFTVDIGPPSMIYCEDVNVLLDTRIRDTLYFKTLWNTGETTPFIRVTESGIYTVEVYDVVCGFSRSDEVAIDIVNDGGGYLVPNAFSPNGDDINDVLKPHIPFNDVEKYHFAIYTIWGELVFQTTDFQQGWDGTIDGVLANPGVYIWKAKLSTDCLGSNDQNKSGTLTLLR